MSRRFVWQFFVLLLFGRKKMQKNFQICNFIEDSRTKLWMRAENVLASLFLLQQHTRIFVRSSREVQFNTKFHHFNLKKIILVNHTNYVPYFIQRFPNKWFTNSKASVQNIFFCCYKQLLNTYFKTCLQSQATVDIWQCVLRDNR